jgi:hypothetical protein
MKQPIWIYPSISRKHLLNLKFWDKGGSELDLHTVVSPSDYISVPESKEDMMILSMIHDKIKGHKEEFETRWIDKLSLQGMLEGRSQDDPREL